MKKATTLYETARRSIGLKKGFSAAEYEMKLLLVDYEYKMAQLDSIMEEIESLVSAAIKAWKLPLVALL